MSLSKPLIRSFAGGEITPELFGRIDLDKFQTGLAKALNFITLPHGPAQNRAGLQFVHEVKDSTKATRLIPFAFSADQTMVLEFGDLYIRFHTDGGTLESSPGTPYEIVSPYAEADLFQIHYTQSADVLTLVHPTYAPRELRRLGATNWAITSPTFAPLIAAPDAPAVTEEGGTTGTLTAHVYVTTAVAADTFEESLASPSATGNQDLTVVGQSNKITPDTVTGAIRYNIYKQMSGGLFGYIGQSDGSAFTDDNIIPDATKTPPEANNPFASTGNYPSAVTYTEQRRCFAGTDNRPQNVWMTRSATESNMCQSVPIQEDDAIIFRIAASQQNRIRHLVPLGELIALTAGGEFRIHAANSDILSPSTVKPSPQSAVGANNVQPAVAENACLYIQAQGAHIRELVNGGSVDGTSSTTYRTNDISILAPHLFDGFTMVDMAYSRAPVPLLWVVRSDGVMLGMTYVPGQNVRAWHQHTTDGLFESVCCVAEGGEDVLYAIVNRTIGGSTKRFVERMHTRQFTALADAFFVDCGLTYDSTATTTISGLGHLEGETVAILADGAVHPQRVVASGSITLQQAASVVHVGLPIPTPTLRTLPVTLETAGFGQGSIKNVNKAHVRVHSSSGYHVGPTDGRLVEAKRRTTEPYGAGPGMKTGYDHVTLNNDWQDDASITIEQRNPLPITVACLVLEVQSG